MREGRGTSSDINTWLQKFQEIETAIDRRREIGEIRDRLDPADPNGYRKNTLKTYTLSEQDIPSDLGGSIVLTFPDMQGNEQRVLLYLQSGKLTWNPDDLQRMERAGIYPEIIEFRNSGKIENCSFHFTKPGTFTVGSRRIEVPADQPERSETGFGATGLQGPIGAAGPSGTIFERAPGGNGRPIDGSTFTGARSGGVLEWEEGNTPAIIHCTSEDDNVRNRVTADIPWTNIPPFGQLYDTGKGIQVFRLDATSSGPAKIGFLFTTAIPFQIIERFAGGADGRQGQLRLVSKTPEELKRMYVAVPVGVEVDPEAQEYAALESDINEFMGSDDTVKNDPMKLVLLAQKAQESLDRQISALVQEERILGQNRSPEGLRTSERIAQVIQDTKTKRESYAQIETYALHRNLSETLVKEYEKAKRETPPDLSTIVKTYREALESELASVNTLPESSAISTRVNFLKATIPTLVSN
ncbi:MAG: hypothetical protein PHZ00_02990 [Candidatus Peribacteraceae bacterium]|nr:hypothetical protein [Candidatus Peribacteraceae bacterium]